LKKIYSGSYNKRRKEKCIVLFSGGLDSTTAIYWALNKKYIVEAIYIDYKHSARDKELKSVMDIADKSGIILHILKNSLSPKIFEEMSVVYPLKGGTKDKYSDMPIFKNTIFSLLIGTDFALRAQSSILIMATNANDAIEHLGFQKKFFKTYEKLVKVWGNKQFKLLIPFLEKSKREIVEIGFKFSVPFELTWSCRYKNEKHCGTCNRCLERSKAFTEARIIDPTEYQYK